MSVCHYICPTCVHHLLAQAQLYTVFGKGTSTLQASFSSTPVARDVVNGCLKFDYPQCIPHSLVHFQKPALFARQQVDILHFAYYSVVDSTKSKKVILNPKT